MKKRRLSIRVLPLLVLFFNSCQNNFIDCDYLLSNVTIVDVKSGSLLSNQYIVIKENRITLVSDQPIKVTSSAKVIDGTGKFAIPGLWDMHAHYWWNHKSSTPLLLSHGILGIREMSGNVEFLRKLKDSASSGRILAPEIVSSGPIIDGYPPVWPGSDTLTSVTGVKQVLDHQDIEGADFFKIYSGLSREVYFELAKYSRSKRKDFCGHVPKSVTIWEAIRQGQRSIEHMNGMLEGCCRNNEQLSAFDKDEWSNPRKTYFLLNKFDSLKFDSLCTILAKSRTWICPTLTVLYSFSHLDDTALTKDSRVGLMPASIRKSWGEYDYRNAKYYEAQKKAFDLLCRLLVKMHRKGVKLLPGTDFPNPYCYPGSSLHDELIMMQKYGIPTRDVLKIATINPVKYLEIDNEYGELTEGKLANFIVVNKNPLLDIQNIKSIYVVFLQGKYLDNVSF